MEELLFNETTEYDVTEEVIESIQEDVIESISENEVIEDGQPDYKPNNIVFNSYVSNNNTYYQIIGLSDNEVSQDQVETVSNDIIYKPINQYSVSESLGLYSFFIGLSILIYLMIRRSIFKWK